MNNTARLASIDTILAGVTTFKCVDGCTDCCGPIFMTRLEWKRIVERVGQKQKDLEREASARLEAGNLECIFVRNNQCSIYDIRPAICRVFGASEHKRLTCPHGARPETLMTNKETDRIIGRVEQLGQ